MSFPASLTPELATKVHAEVAKGTPITYVADLLRIGRQTFYDWVSKGEAILAGEREPAKEAGGIQPDYADFVLGLRAARATAVIGSVEAVRKSERGHAGHQFWLERQIREEFGPKSEVEVKHSGSVALVDWSTAQLGDLGEAAIDVEFEEVPLALETTKPGG